MKADFTRFRFDPAQHYRRVYDQQGRVEVDADGNEAEDIAEHLRGLGIRDVVGQSGGPLNGAGFALAAAGADLTIGAGRYWVDGGLVEHDTSGASVLAQPYVPAGTSAVLLPSGQPGPVTPSDGVYLAFLETWERLLTAVEEDSLREPALGGPDTTVRTQQVWQVRLLRVGAVGTAVNCLSDLPAWNTLVAPPTVTMAARSAVSDAPPDDCTVPADAGFRGTENQHYRVEIHDGGAVGTATFVWSRENGSVVTRWVARSGDELTVSSPGRDGSLGFGPGDWVELIDEGRELTGRPGTLVRLAGASGDRLVIDAATATGSVDLADFPVDPRVRRWDSDGPLTVQVPATNDGWIALELGVEVHWPASGSFRTGQWWSVPARTALDDVIWPAPGGVPATLPPFGDRHYFARLATAEKSGGTWTVLSDCRSLFPPLTGLESLFALGGDGQEALPNVTAPATLVPLAEPLRVGVAKGRTPVAGASVQFSVTTGNGQVNGAATATVVTGPDGVASAAWSVDSATASQVVTARLLDAGGTPVHLPVRFDASLSFASEIAYVPGDCAELAGASTVQQALDILCANGGDGCATLVLSPGPNWFAPLLALPDGADARICFRPGVFTTPQPVIVQNKGSLVISGAGQASKVVAPTREIALLFSNCAEVVVRDLSISAQVPLAAKGINGALTIEGVRRVTVEGVTLQCGAAATRASSCITVRSLDKVFPEVVRIRDCDLLVGHQQVGVLLLGAFTSEVTGNTVRAAPKPASLSFEALLADPTVRGALVRQLLSRPLGSGASSVRAPSFTTTIQAGGYTLGFNSPVPQQEWQALADAHPPTANDVANPAALRQWATTLAGNVLNAPAGLPAFRRQITGVQRRVGNAAFNQVVATPAGRELLATSLISSDILVLDRAAVAGDRQRAVQLGNARVVFDSVLNVDTWMRMFAVAGITQVANGIALKNVMYELARRALVDANFRAASPQLALWFGNLVNRNPAVASQGVVVGGGTALAVRVTDNQLLGVAEGVHVGLSVGPRGVLDRQAGKVEIRGNRAVLRVPMELLRAPRAIFVGNARNTVVAENEATVEGQSGQAVEEGVRVWGHLGPFMRIADNLLAGSATGVFVQPVDVPPSRWRWTVQGNVAPDATIGVSAPTPVIRLENSP